MWFYPKNHLCWLDDPVQYLLNDTSMMVFVCPVTLKVVECGPQGTGWEVRSPREFVSKVMPTLLISIFVMQAAILEGMEVSIPLALRNYRYDVSVDTTSSPSKLVERALINTSEEKHFMRCMSAFTDAVRQLINPSDAWVNHLFRKVKLQQNRFERKRNGSAPLSYPIISLGNTFPVVMFEESYKSVHTFLTTGDNVKLGALEDQLCEQMEHVMTDDGLAEWVCPGASQEWLQMHARCVGGPALLHRKSPTMDTSVNKEPESVSDNHWLANQLRKKGVKEYFIVLCEQKLVTKEGVVDKVTFAKMRPEWCNIDYLRSIGILDFATQKALITIHAEITQRPFEADIQRRLQGRIVSVLRKWFQIILRAHFFISVLLQASTKNLQRRH